MNRPAPRKRVSRAAPRVTPLQTAVTAALDDMKAVNVKVLDVRGITDFADTLVVASGTSDRHVRSIADRVVQMAKEAGFRPLGTEGTRDGEWVLVDLQDVVVHVMLPRVREFYGLESLWDQAPTEITPAPAAVTAAPAASRAAASPKPRAGAAPRKTAGTTRRAPAKRRKPPTH